MPNQKQAETKKQVEVAKAVAEALIKAIDAIVWGS